MCIRDSPSIAESIYEVHGLDKIVRRLRLELYRALVETRRSPDMGRSFRALVTVTTEFCNNPSDDSDHFDHAEFYYNVRRAVHHVAQNMHMLDGSPGPLWPYLVGRSHLTAVRWRELRHGGGGEFLKPFRRSHSCVRTHIFGVLS